MAFHVHAVKCACFVMEFTEENIPNELISQMKECKKSSRIGFFFSLSLRAPPMGGLISLNFSFLCSVFSIKVTIVFNQIIIPPVHFHFTSVFSPSSEFVSGLDEWHGDNKNCFDSTDSGK